MALTVLAHLSSWGGGGVNSAGSAQLTRIHAEACGQPELPREGAGELAGTHVETHG